MRVQEQGGASQRLPVLCQPFLLLQNQRAVPHSVRLCDCLQLPCGIRPVGCQRKFRTEGDSSVECGGRSVASVLL